MIKEVLITVSFVSMAVISVLQTNKINDLQDQLINLETVVNHKQDLSTSDLHALQDSLEERIGTLEHELEDIKLNLDLSR